MNMNRKVAKKIYVDSDIDDGFVEAERHDLISMIHLALGSIILSSYLIRKTDDPLIGKLINPNGLQSAEKTNGGK